MVTSSVLASSAAKSVATVGLSAGILGLGGWAWGCAIIGAFFAVYLEKEKEPEKIITTIVGIMAGAFGAALLAVALPFVPWFGIGSVAKEIPLDVRAGILGLTLRWMVSKGKSVLESKAKGWGEK